MENFEIPDNPELNLVMRKIMTDDAVHADFVNAYFEKLLINDAFLEKLANKMIGKDMIANVLDSTNSDMVLGADMAPKIVELINGKSPTSHTHDDRYFTETEINTKLSSKSDTSHTHDDRYFTESEMNAKLGSKSDTSHTHSDYISRSLGSSKSWADQYVETGVYVHKANATEVAMGNDYLPYISIAGTTGDSWLVEVTKYSTQWSINKYYQIYGGRKRYGLCLVDHTNSKRYWIQKVDAAA